MRPQPFVCAYDTCPLPLLTVQTVLHLGRVMRSMGGRGAAGGSTIPFRAAAKALARRLSETNPPFHPAIPSDILEEARCGLLEAQALLNAEDDPSTVLRLDSIRGALRQLMDVFDEDLTQAGERGPASTCDSSM